MNMPTAINSSKSLELNQNELDQVLNAFEIPTCPALVSEVLQEARKEEPDLKRLSSIIGADVGMSAITLKMANSVLFRSGAKVDNVQRALQRLGVRNLTSIVMGVALRSSMHGLPHEFVERFWLRSSTHAIASGMIARRQYGISSDAAYTYALFQDAAIPLMLRRFPNYTSLIESAWQRGESRMQAERQLPCTHPIIGALLVRNWGLPGIVAQAIRFHHEPDVYALSDQVLSGGAISLIAVGQVSEYLLAKSFPEEVCEVDQDMFQRALSHLGIYPDELDELQDLITSAAAEARQ